MMNSNVKRFTPDELINKIYQELQNSKLSVSFDGDHNSSELLVSDGKQ